jgi:hypothetical protein
MKKNFLMTLAFAVIFSMAAKAQESDDENTGQNFTVSADLVTNYIWRGLAYSDAPNIQPTLAFTNNKGNFTLGAFGSYSLGDFYSEVNMFASFTAGPVTFEIWDYFTMGQMGNNRFFDYKKETTTHALEGIIMLNGPENFPIQFTAGTFFYGNDLNDEGKNYYSTYLELAYPFKWKNNNLRVFAGVTPMEGLYGSEFAMNNIGITNEREIRINDKFSIPVSGSLIINPHLENIYLVFTLSLSAND